MTDKVTSRRLSTERKVGLEDKASEAQHSEALPSPTRRQRSRTEAILEKDQVSTETRSKVENTPSSRVSFCTWAHETSFNTKLRLFFLLAETFDSQAAAVGQLQLPQ